MRSWIIGLAAIGFASGAQAGTWTVCPHPELGFSIEAPAPLATASTTQATAMGPVKTVVFAIVENDTSPIALAVADYSGVNLAGLDVQKALDAAVKDPLGRLHAVLLTQTPITVDGFPGREITGRADPDGLLVKGRIVFTGRRLYQLVAIGPATSGVLADFDRLEASLKISK
jgi:hypothetical protein